MKKLEDMTHRQQVFLTSVIKYRQQGVGGATREAARDAGFQYEYARKFIAEPPIKEFLQAQTAETIKPILDRTKVDAEFIINGYRRIAAHDPLNEFEFDEEGTPKLLHVTEMDQDARMTIGAKVSDVRAALADLARINAMFTDNVNHGVTFNGILDEIAEMDGSDEPLVNDD